jgi:glycine/D-amino acid oxidase-like deaminating enzyme
MTSLWQQQSAPFGAAVPLPERADVAIIGGGIAGIATALHLAQQGIDVVVLEQRTVAARASGRNDGQLLLGLGEHYHRIHGQFGAEKARLLWDFLRDNHDALREALAAFGVDCELRNDGGLRLAETPHEWTELQDAATLLAAEGKPHRLVPAGDLPTWLPAAVGFHGALYLVGEAIVQPVSMVIGLARAAASKPASSCTARRRSRADSTAAACWRARCSRSAARSWRPTRCRRRRCASSLATRCRATSATSTSASRAIAS